MAEDYTPIGGGRPFVGGAEQARRNARKRLRQPPRRRNSGNSHHRQHKRRGSGPESIAPYPKSMREYERFFGSLLSSSPSELRLSETDGGAHQRVMHRACSLLGVPSLPAPAHLQQQPGSLNEKRCHEIMRRSSSCVSNASYSSTASTSSSGTFDNARSYYMSKAPLILEESRCIVAESLAKVSHGNNKRGGGGGGGRFNLELVSTEEKYPKVAERQPLVAPLILTFDVVDESSASNGNPRSVSSALKRCQRGKERRGKWTRPGSVLLLRQQGKDGAADSSVLACVVPNGNWQSSSNDATLSLMIFRREDLCLAELLAENDSGEKLSFTATALTTLIAQVRQMEACLRMVKVPFMTKLLGQKGATHIRFGDSSDDEDGEEADGTADGSAGANNILQEGFYVDDGSSAVGGEDGGSEDDENNRDWSLAGLLTKIPQLNQTQERAASSFLGSPKESLILVQGPPGTGKSTFLVNVICRRLAANPGARLLVTAPTNRAVTVLAERFLDVVSKSEEDLSSKCNAVLVGVEDKLISSSSKNEAEYISAEALSSSLRGIFVYTWIEEMKGECESLLASMKKLRAAAIQHADSEDAESLGILISRAVKVQTKICHSIPKESSACRCSKLLVRNLQEMGGCESMEELEDLSCGSFSSQLEMAIGHAQSLVDALDDVESPVQELLATARVIFCTLATAGSSILKQSRRIDDLLIDEAAAATEPEICIPFHLRPQRLLAVGDPLQLPPTIMSRHAADMGLSVSLHERLMGLGAEHFLLGHQYRMNPHISRFPCAQFYDGRILDGENVKCPSYSSGIQLPKKSPYLFVNVRGEEYQVQWGGSYANDAECAAVVNLVEMIAARKVLDWHSPDKLRIITFYQGQVMTLQRALRKRGLGKALVATVDSSQGCEADVVIVSFVRSSSSKTGVRHSTGFLTDDRRVNVALTRARHQLFCVGDAEGTLGLRGSETLKSLVSDARQRGCLVEAN